MIFFLSAKLEKGFVVTPFGFRYASGVSDSGWLKHSVIYQQINPDIKLKPRVKHHIASGRTVLIKSDSPVDHQQAEITVKIKVMII